MRLVLLDAGGVLFDDVFETSPFFQTLAGRFRVSPRALRDRYMIQSADVVCGRKSGFSALRNALIYLNVAIADISPRAIWQLYGELVRPNEALFSYLQSRRGRDGSNKPSDEAPFSPPVSDFHLSLANNEGRDWDAQKNARFGHFGLFDSLSSSWLLGAAKPAPEYFQSALCRLGVDPLDALFVDDRTECLEAADALGLATHRYTSTTDLISRLQSF